MVLLLDDWYAVLIASGGSLLPVRGLEAAFQTRGLVEASTKYVAVNMVDDLVEELTDLLLQDIVLNDNGASDVAQVSVDELDLLAEVKRDDLVQFDHALVLLDLLLELLLFKGCRQNNLVLLVQHADVVDGHCTNLFKLISL